MRNRLEIFGFFEGKGGRRARSFGAIAFLSMKIASHFCRSTYGITAIITTSIRPKVDSRSVNPEQFAVEDFKPVNALLGRCPKAYFCRIHSVTLCYVKGDNFLRPQAAYQEDCDERAGENQSHF